MDLTPYLTPHKLNRPVLTGSGLPGAFDGKAVDVPFVFEHNGLFHMTYVGFDGHGYQTALATSSDLLNWQHAGLILRRGEGNGWDSANAAGTWLLCENDLDGPRTLERWQGRYWLAYHSYPGDGYEVGPARFGLAWTEDENLLHWERLPEPFLTPEGGEAWEQGGLYKLCLIHHDGLFYLFYNAKDVHAVEQTGLATSPDLHTWTRHPANPVLRVTPGAWDSRFRSDPYVVRDRDRWLMFHFGYDGRHAQEGIAWSDDLLTWQQHPEPILRVGPPGSLDSIHAHKPALIRHQGVLYHYYCACRPHQEGDPTDNGGEFRCLTVATSAPVP